MEDSIKDVYADIKKTLDAFLDELNSLPQDIRQLAWGMVTVAYVPVEEPINPNDFYYRYGNLVDNLRHVFRSTSKLRQVLEFAMQNEFNFATSTDSILKFARDTQVLMLEFAFAFIPPTLKAVSIELANKCKMFCDTCAKYKQEETA